MKSVHHSSSMIEYTLNKSRLSLHTKRERAFCRRCRKPLKTGDRIVRKYQSGPARKTQLYHIECAEEMEAWRDNDKEKFYEELADIAIRLFDTAYWAGCDLEKEIRKKMDYNWKREKNHGRTNV